jgi:hypothetical protein
VYTTPLLRSSNAASGPPGIFAGTAASSAVSLLLPSPLSPSMRRIRLAAAGIKSFAKTVRISSQSATLHSIVGGAESQAPARALSAELPVIHAMTIAASSAPKRCRCEMASGTNRTSSGTSETDLTVPGWYPSPRTRFRMMRISGIMPGAVAGACWRL